MTRRSIHFTIRKVTITDLRGTYFYANVHCAHTHIHIYTERERWRAVGGSLPPKVENRNQRNLNIILISLP